MFDSFKLIHIQTNI